jgi:histidine triad (HIT) family protein
MSRPTCYWFKPLILRHQVTAFFLCAAVAQESLLNSTVAYSRTVPLQRSFHQSSHFGVTVQSPNNRQQLAHLQKMSTSSTPHDEIVKAMAAAAEVREQSADDDAPPTIFDKLVSGEIPCKKVYEDDIALAFHDVNPVAPIHILVIPKVRGGLTQISKATTNQHQAVMGHCMMVASQVGKQFCGDNGFRLVINDGEHGGQSVYHLHIHVMGGRQMQWPPG